MDNKQIFGRSLSNAQINQTKKIKFVQTAIIYIALFLLITESTQKFNKDKQLIQNKGIICFIIE
jgi:hypothetical protein